MFGLADAEFERRRCPETLEKMTTWESRWCWSAPFTRVCRVGTKGHRKAPGSTNMQGRLEKRSTLVRGEE